MSIGVHVSFEYRVFSKYIPMSGITESDGSYTFSFLSNLHTILHNGCTNVPTNSVGWFLFVPPLWSIYYFQIFFDDGHSDQCEVIDTSV